jgi:UDP-N-acetylmuramyl pentapeptide synthase
VEIADALMKYEPAPGRMRLLPGIKRSFLIDDTYNSAPRSVKAALDLLDELPRNSLDDKKFAVLGDMLELGEGSEAAHREIGAYAEKAADVLVFVGERMVEAERAAREAGAGDDRVFHFARAEEAGRFVQERMKQGDAILVKGSRGMEMERTVKELLAVPMLAKKLLVKFHPEWEM